MNLAALDRSSVDDSPGRGIEPFDDKFRRDRRKVDCDAVFELPEKIPDRVSEHGEEAEPLRFKPVGSSRRRLERYVY